MIRHNTVSLSTSRCRKEALQESRIASAAVIAATGKSQWLRIQCGDSQWYFELEHGSGRAIVVGSSRDAEVRILAAHPITFILEWDGGAIGLTPVYPGVDLRISGRKLDCRKRLLLPVFVEFAEQQLAIQTVHEPPQLPESPAEMVPGDATPQIDQEAPTIQLSQVAAHAALRGSAWFSRLEEDSRQVPLRLSAPNVPATTSSEGSDQFRCSASTLELSREDIQRVLAGETPNGLGALDSSRNTAPTVSLACLYQIKPRMRQELDSPSSQHATQATDLTHESKSKRILLALSKFGGLWTVPSKFGEVITHHPIRAVVGGAAGAFILSLFLIGAFHLVERISDFTTTNTRLR